MKKHLSLFLILIMTLSVLFTAPVYAVGEADNITVELPAEAPTLSVGMTGEFSYKLLNSSDICAAREYLMIDEVLISDPDPNYFMIFSEASRKISYTVPSAISGNQPHTLTVRLWFRDGAMTEKSIPVVINSEPDKVGMNFMVYSESVTLDSGFSCGVQFTFPDQSRKYVVRTSVSVNDRYYSEFDRTHTLSHGDIVYFNIPAWYTDPYSYNYNFRITANADPISGKGTDYISVGVPVISDYAAMGTAVQSMVNPVVITAYVKRNTSGYSYSSLTGYRTTIPAGSYVAYLNPDNHNSMRAAKVRTSQGGIYWVSMSDIYITTGNYVIADNLTPEQKEHFVNYRGYSSETGYLIWVNLERQILTVFSGSKGNWHFKACFPVASGKNATPTPTVEHRIEYVTRWVTPEYTCDPVLALYDGYAIHNQPVSPSGYVTDTTIGRPASAGCVRMLKKDVDWVRSVVPVKTNVVIY